MTNINNRVLQTRVAISTRHQDEQILIELFLTYREQAIAHDNLFMFDAWIKSGAPADMCDVKTFMHNGYEPNIELDNWIDTYRWGFDDMIQGYKLYNDRTSCVSSDSPDARPDARPDASASGAIIMTMMVTIISLMVVATCYDTIPGVQQTIDYVYTWIKTCFVTG